MSSDEFRDDELEIADIDLFSMKVPMVVTAARLS
jgi:hypothetical protein